MNRTICQIIFQHCFDAVVKDDSDGREDDGFQKSTIAASNGWNYELYCHNPVDVIVEKVVKTPSED